MDKAYPPEAWKRLGEELQKRRGQLGYGFRQRGDFLTDRGGPPPSAKMLARLERGERGAYPPSTITRLEALYEYAPGSFEAILAGGEGTPVAAPPRAPLRAAPDAPPSAPGSPAEEILADLLARYPDDKIITDVLGSQVREGKPARVIVNEILGWLDFLESKAEHPQNGTSAGLPGGLAKGMVKIAAPYCSVMAVHRHLGVGMYCETPTLSRPLPATGPPANSQSGGINASTPQGGEGGLCHA